MRRLAALLMIPLGAVLLGSTCVEPDFGGIPRLEAPVFTMSEVTGVRFRDAYREAVHLSWSRPDTEQNSVAEYRLIQSARNDSDAVTITGIPDSITDYYGRTDQLLLDRSVSQTIYYRVFAVDTQGTAGDTSSLCSLSVAPLPVLTSPTDADTLRSNRFAWVVRGIATAYNTHMTLWDTAGPVWESDYQNNDYTGYYAEDEFNDSLPSHLFPLAPGNYWWGARLYIFETLATSVKVGTFDVAR